MSRSIIKKTVGIGSSTLLSRFFAYIREILLMDFLGISAVSDAFFIALRVPNSLRKVFAEGALSSVLVPALIHAERKDGSIGVNRLLTLSFLMIEAIVGMIVVLICCNAYTIVYQMAPGASAERPGPCLRRRGRERSWVRRAENFSGCNPAGWRRQFAAAR